MPESVVHGHHLYRSQGGEIHRRPVSIRADEPPWAGSWLVLNHDDDYVPPAVREQLAAISAGVRFD